MIEPNPLIKLKLMGAEVLAIGNEKSHYWCRVLGPLEAKVLITSAFAQDTLLKRRYSWYLRHSTGGINLASGHHELPEQAADAVNQAARLWLLELQQALDWARTIT